jgi:hypothetical protein
MSTQGQRKAALYLASLHHDEQVKLLACLPLGVAKDLRPLLSKIIANGWNDDEIVNKVLADEILGLTADSSMSVDVVIALANALPDDWTARLFVANTAVDARFLLSLIENAHAKRVQVEILHVPRLPEQLKLALLAEALESVSTAA